MFKIFLYQILTYIKRLMGFPGGSVVKESTCNAGNLGWEDPLEEGMATHPSILTWRIPMDRGAWRATVHGVAKRQTRLSNSARTKRFIHIYSFGECTKTSKPCVHYTVQCFWAVCDTMHHNLEEAHFKCSWAMCAGAHSTGQCRSGGFQKYSSIK